MSIKDKTITALGWGFLGRFAEHIGQFAITICLARLLVPEDFGIVAMAVVLVEFAMLCTVHGFPASLVQKQKLSTGHIYSVFLDYSWHCSGSGKHPFHNGTLFSLSI